MATSSVIAKRSSRSRQRKTKQAAAKIPRDHVVLQKKKLNEEVSNKEDMMDSGGSKFYLRFGGGSSHLGTANGTEFIIDFGLHYLYFMKYLNLGAMVDSGLSYFTVTDDSVVLGQNIILETTALSIFLKPGISLGIGWFTLGVLYAPSVITTVETTGGGPSYDDFLPIGYSGVLSFGNPRTKVQDNRYNYYFQIYATVRELTSTDTTSHFGGGFGIYF